MVLVEVEIMFNLKLLSLQKKKKQPLCTCNLKQNPHYSRECQCQDLTIFEMPPHWEKPDQEIQESQGVEMYH